MATDGTGSSRLQTAYVAAESRNHSRDGIGVGAGLGTGDLFVPSGILIDARNRKITAGHYLVLILRRNIPGTW